MASTQTAEMQNKLKAALPFKSRSWDEYFINHHDPLGIQSPSENGNGT